MTKEYTSTRNVREDLDAGTMRWLFYLTSRSVVATVTVTAAFSADGDMSAVPVDVPKVERHDFTCT